MIWTFCNLGDPLPWLLSLTSRINIVDMCACRVETNMLKCWTVRLQSNTCWHEKLPGLVYPEAEFLEVIGTKVLRVFLLAIHRHLYQRSYSPTALRKSGLKLVCNVNIVYRNLMSENSQDYAQKPQRNCTFMNSPSGLAKKEHQGRIF